VTGVDPLGGEEGAVGDVDVLEEGAGTPVDEETLGELGVVFPEFGLIGVAGVTGEFSGLKEEPPPPLAGAGLSPDPPPVVVPEGIPEPVSELAVPSVPLPP
jgi:hypothetical protein